MNPITITLPASGASLAPISIAGQAALYDTVPVTASGRVWDTGHTYLAIISAHDDHLGGTDAVTVTADAETGVLTWSFDLALTSAALVAACAGPRVRVTLSLWDAVAGRHVFRVPLDVQYAAEPAGFVPSDPSITPATAGQIAAAIAAAGLGTGDVSGPASSTDGGLVAFSGPTGKILKAGPAIGTTAGTVAAGDDERFTDARAPTAHASTHATGEADALTPGAIGAEAAGAVSSHNDAPAAHPFSAVDKYRYGGVDGATTEGTITAAGRAILDDATAADQQATLGLPKANLAATVAPAVTDDSTDGYSVGSRWIDTVGAVEYVCMDPSAGAAVWEATTGAAASGIGGSTGAVDNAILRADGADGATLQAGSLTIEDAATATQANVQIKVAHAGQTNSALVLTPQGNGALVLGARPDGAAAGGNARGAGAVDLQLVYHVVNTYVASGQQAFAAVGPAMVSGKYAAAIGTYAVASGNSAMSMGNCTASGERSFAGGFRAVAEQSGQFAWASGWWANNQVCQYSILVLRAATGSTDATLMLMGEGDPAPTRPVIPAERTWDCLIRVAGRQDDGKCGSAWYGATLERTGNTTRLVGSVAIVRAWNGDAELGTPTIAITADDTNEALQVAVSAADTTPTRWMASVEIAEATY